MALNSPCWMRGSMHQRQDGGNVGAQAAAPAMVRDGEWQGEKQMTEQKIRRAHVIAGGFPPGAPAGHDHDYARLRLLGLLGEEEIPASVANDFADIEKWLPVSKLLITYVAGPLSRRGADTCHARLARSGRSLAGPARHQRRAGGTC